MHSVAFLQDLAVVMIVAGAGDDHLPSFQAAGGARLHHRRRHHRPAHAAVSAHPRRGHDQHAGGAGRHPADVLARAGIQPAQAASRSARRRFIAALLEILLMVLGRLRNRPAFRLEHDGQHFPRRDAFHLLHHHHRQGARANWARRRSGSPQLIFGILIIEDILAIAMIALLSGIAMTGTLERGRRRADARQARHLSRGRRWWSG